MGQFDDVWGLARAFGVIVDAEGVVIEVTDSVYAVTSVPVSVFKGTLWTSWYLPGAGLRPDVIRTPQGDIPVRVTERGHDLRSIWVEDASALVDARFQADAYKDELRQLEYAVSHDLMEPLRNVTTHLTWWQQDPDPQHVTDAITSAKQIHKLLTDFLQYLRLDTHRRRDLMHEVDMNVLMNDVIQSLRLLVKEADADILFSDLPVVHGDSRMLYQIFANLVSNALKYRHPDRRCRIDVTATALNDRWVINVIDNGRGIPQSKKERIWVPFARVHRHEGIAGSGIGLAIVRRCVRYHGGDVAVYSQTDTGTTMSVALPFQK